MFPPSSLLELCSPPAPRVLKLTRDVLDSRTDLELAYNMCSAKMHRLIEWLVDKENQDMADIK